MQGDVGGLVSMVSVHLDNTLKLDKPYRSSTNPC